MYKLIVMVSLLGVGYWRFMVMVSIGSVSRWEF